ncbi:MAG: hypothetical protein M3376_05940 [Actinomycetota bacterium]|nr:hypothetical protein [Actinomycetota bacterium]
MKFGKRGEGDDVDMSGATAGDSFVPPPPPAPATPPPLPPVPESRPADPTDPSVLESPPPFAEQEVPGAPAGQELPIVQVEPVVEGEAYEVFADEPPETLAVHQHQHEPEPLPTPTPMPFPVAEQPISVVTPGPAPAPVTTLGESGEAFASGHAAVSGPSWQEPVMELANERPELVVAAAFVGGLLAAMILRRLGN